MIMSIKGLKAQEKAEKKKTPVESPYKLIYT